MYVWCTGGEAAGPAACTQQCVVYYGYQLGQGVGDESQHSVFGVREGGGADEHTYTKWLIHLM